MIWYSKNCQRRGQYSILLDGSQINLRCIKYTIFFVDAMLLDRGQTSRCRSMKEHPPRRNQFSILKELETRLIGIFIVSTHSRKRRCDQYSILNDAAGGAGGSAGSFDTVLFVKDERKRWSNSPIIINKNTVNKQAYCFTTLTAGNS